MKNFDELFFSCGNKWLNINTFTNVNKNIIYFKDSLIRISTILFIATEIVHTKHRFLFFSAKKKKKKKKETSSIKEAKNKAILKVLPRTITTQIAN